ncbi:MAG TPA: baseplate J/gp47 family protein, partial [Thermomicrobiales bacterium]|nr:baseplate J/gp47 family protein [Thermomicrobiales bacterium]
ILNLARSAGVEIELATDDPLRRELAKILGFRLVADTSPATDRQQESNVTGPADSKTFKIVRPAAPETVDVTADEPDWHDAETRPGLTPWRTTESPIPADEPDDADDDIDDGSYSFVIHPPTTRRAVTQPFEQPARQHETVPSFEIWEAGHEPFEAWPERSSSRRLRPFAWISLLLTVALVGAMLVMFLLPAATIAVTPVESQVSASLTYGVALPGTNWDIPIQPVTLSTTLTFSATSPTTGERFEPDASAHGSLMLTNASTGEVLVPAGTIMATETGIQFATVADVTVPAADPYGSLTIGSATVEVTATAPGPDSNVAAETVFGQLDSGIYFLNRDPIGGGTTRRIATVSQADIDTLTARAQQDLNGKAPGAIDRELKDGQQLLANTETRGQISTSFNHAAGSDAESLKLDASLTITAQAYSLDGIHDQARDAVADRLRSQAGNEVTVLSQTLKTSTPQPVAGTDATAFSVDASATTRANISSEELDALRAELSGKDDEAAVARIKQLAGVGDVTIDHSPGWLGGRMPRLDSRIQIEVVDAARVQTQTTSSRP